MGKEVARNQVDPGCREGTAHPLPGLLPSVCRRLTVPHKMVVNTCSDVCKGWGTQ